MKKCSKCKKVKDITAFGFNRSTKDGRNCYCLECMREQVKNWQRENREKYRECKSRLNKKKKDKYRKTTQQWRDANRDRVRETMRLWRESHPENIREHARKSVAKRASTPRGRLNNSVRGEISRSIKGNKNGRHWETLVGYTLEELMTHLEKNFVSGMSWDNHNQIGWHIDHVIPLSAFNFSYPEDIDFRKAWALKNLRPMWAKDNLLKWTKLSKPFQPSLSLTG